MSPNSTKSQPINKKKHPGAENTTSGCSCFSDIFEENQKLSVAVLAVLVLVAVLIAAVLIALVVLLVLVVSALVVLIVVLIHLQSPLSET